MKKNLYHRLDRFHTSQLLSQEAISIGFKVAKIPLRYDDHCQDTRSMKAFCLFPALLFSDMAQRMFQMQRMRDDIEYEELQRLQQRTLLQCVSPFFDDSSCH